MITIANFFKEEEDLLYRLGQEKGLEKGLEKGMEKGMEKGQEKGIEKGLEKGEHKKAVATAIEMLLDNAPLNLIAKYTKLSTEEIQALAQENRL